ncbi:MAG TPA: nitrite reductase (NAD(P)H) small subunit [Gemmatimonadaceae bacterium]|nr:nitrite reductase (NAD(P)H) small subunit [Gemmatimonadaceae bacterium]
MTAAPTPLDDTVAFDLGSVERIPPGEGQTFLVAGREIAVFRARGTDAVYATQARCPHKAGLLADGIVGDGKVICPLHSYKFDLASGTPLGNACQTLTTFRAEITGERRVLLWLSPARAWSGGV